MARTEPLWSWDNGLRDIYRTIGNVAWLSRAFCSECGGSVASAVCRCLAPHSLLPVPATPGVVYTEGASGRPRCDFGERYDTGRDEEKRSASVIVYRDIVMMYEGGSDVKTDHTEGN